MRKETKKIECEKNYLKEVEPANTCPPSRLAETDIVEGMG
jgi:hypothetical protein